MEFFNSAIEVLQTLVVALGAGLGVWGGVNLLEADYLVNADESSYPHAAIETARDHLFRTATGRALLSAIYLEH